MLSLWLCFLISFFLVATCSCSDFDLSDETVSFGLQKFKAFSEYQLALNDSIILNSIKAFIYSYPLYCTNLQLQKFMKTNKYNTFYHQRDLVNASNPPLIVSPNADTVYSTSFIDLSTPVLISVPEAYDRYYVIELMDMYTNNWHSIGRRTYGTGPGTFLLKYNNNSMNSHIKANHNHQHSFDSHYIHLIEKVYNVNITDTIIAPTPTVWALMRILADGENDLAGVHALQDGISITPIDNDNPILYNPLYSQSTIDKDLILHSPYTLYNPTGIEYLTLISSIMSHNPAPSVDSSYLNSITASLGLDAKGNFDPNQISLANQTKINLAIALGFKIVESLGSDSTPKFIKTNNGWISLPPGSVGVYGTHYAIRLYVAVKYIAANVAQEAVYFHADIDSNNQTLTGANGSKYVISLSNGTSSVPCNAFWSITVYNASNYFFIENAIDRYSIGDRTKGLIPEADGITINLFLQADEPTDVKEKANWLPIPNERFYLLLRSYQPTDVILNGQFAAPLIKPY